MPVDREIDQMPLSEKWAALADRSACPARLMAFVGSQLIVVVEEDGSTALFVELAPGMTSSDVAHLAEPLASFFDGAVGSVEINDVPAKARRVQITLKASYQ